MFGLIHLPWWGYILVVLGLTQITILATTLYLHRCQAHRALDLHPIVSHFFRFWLWLTTGTVTKEWTAVHRKHHARVETKEDPHSPQVLTIKKVLLEGAELYRKETRNLETLKRFGEGTPDDWIERNVYTKHSLLGILIMLGIDVVLFGTIGLTVWALQMASIPFFAAGIINGVGHYLGYRNFECKDASRNVSPWGLLLGGEELHNNHHAYATSAKFSAKWWEIDTGWLVIRTLQFFGLAKPKRMVPKPIMQSDKTSIDTDTLQAVIMYRMQVMARYARDVVTPAIRAEKKRAPRSLRSLLLRGRTILIRDASLMKASQQKRLTSILENFQSLRVVYQFRLKLQEIWSKSTASQKDLIEALQNWCEQAEATGLEALREFSNRLKTYVPSQKTEVR